jgi:hypothetical protein
MADNISEIISPEGERQLRELNEGLESAIQNITKFGQVAKGITVEFKGVKDFATLNELQNKVKETTEKMTKAQRDFADEIDRAQVREQAAVAKALAGYEKQAAAKEKAEQRAIAAQQARVKKEEDALNRMIAAEEKANAKAIAAQQKRAAVEEKILNKMIADEEKAAAKKEQLAQRAAAEAEKAAAREAKALAVLNNEYEQAKRAYNATAAEAKRLAFAVGENSKEFKDAAANAKVMYEQLLKVEMAVGQGQRQVGQYNQAAFAMQQLLRETPAFAYSFGTGIMAISNNIPILIDEIKRLKVANEELKASGAKTIPIWKTLLGSIFSPTGILTLGIGIFTILATKLDIFKNKTKDATDATKKLNDELKEIDKQAQKSAASEQSRVAVLVQTAKNTALAMDIRTNAVKQLQEMYPAYLGNLSKEKMLTGDITDALYELNKAITARAMATAIGDKITKEYEKIIAAEAELGRMRDKTMMGTGVGGAPQAFIYDQDERTQALQDSIAASEEAIKQYEKLVDKYTVASAKLIDTKTGKGTTTKGTTTATNEALKAAYDAGIAELENNRDKNESIYQDETKSLEERLNAYNAYNAAVLQILEEQRNKEVELEREKIKQAEQERKTATGQALQNTYDAEYAALIRISQLNKDFDAKTAAETAKAKQDILNIVYSNNEKWIKSEEFRNEKLKELQINLFLKDAELLNRALQNKEITQKEYNKRMAHLRKTEGAMLLQDDIDLYEKLLQNQTLSAEKQLEIQKKLNQARKAKSQMSQGRASKSGRLTDGLATSLGITDESEQQAFYDASINLANQAADAIISANRRQYEAEMAMLDRKREAIQTNYDLQMNLIDATSKTEEEYAERVAKLNSQRAEQEAAIEQQKKEAAIKQARFEKAAAIASIIQNTAVAIASALKLGPAAPFVVALIAAAGAAQLASVASAPIPAYKEGTDYHKGGAFIAGDGGAPELIAPPNKAPYWSASTSTLYNESAGTKVIPIDKYLKNVDATGGYRIGSVNSTANDNPYKWIEAINNGFSETGEALALSWAQIARANRPNINMNAIAEEMRRERNLQGK